ncbi:hypothetical protein [Aquimarina sp. MMG016]|uniref:hypothetical protein n=1 Tax=Aquimarina sp. MMG016 TaxID=2822690 RepID=UPI001B3A6D8C|nr:hypothetical protein [Aquimarina sp. MMG016]MBQ4821496.1 hypothetical protein [Aquimarina sp. MMG016]
MNTDSRTYRLVYILIATIISSIVLFYFAKAIPELIPNDNMIKEVFMCSGQIFWQDTILMLCIKKKMIIYLYQMITVSLLGSLLLIPLLIIHQQLDISLKIRIGGFLAIVLGMIIDHFRRVKKLTLPSYLTITWILYRALWLPILLF